MRHYFLLFVFTFCFTSRHAVAQGTTNVDCQTIRKVHQTSDSGLPSTARSATPLSKVFRIYDTKNRKTAWYTIAINRSYLGHVDFNITVNGSVNCITKGDSIAFVFQDGTDLRMANARDSNCEGSALVVLGEKVGTQKQLDIFSSKDIKTMKIQKGTKTQKITFPEEDSQIIRQTIQCLAAKEEEAGLVLQQEAGRKTN